MVSKDFARNVCALSYEIRRQIGTLINRSGRIQYLVVGDRHGIMIPELERSRSARLRGLRLVHTHLNGEALSQEDLYDLTLLRLDYITAITMNGNGIPAYYYNAHILPGTDPGYQLEQPCRPGELRGSFSQRINELENLFAKSIRENGLLSNGKGNRAVLVGVYTPAMRQKRTPEESIQELQELCCTVNVQVVDIITQKRSSLDPKNLVGEGKAKQIALQAVQQNAELLIFDLELAPSQAKRLSQLCDLKILDRTQLILDIFANNARSRDGKLQVELAQLRYLKERLSQKDDSISRLTGGIGGRGPGETKLEIGRRRVQERIQNLEKEWRSLEKRRCVNRSRRKGRIPMVSIVGYTNAGKSTLLNALTRSEVLVERRLFATLEPTTRRLRFPKEKEIVLADTIGFIHDLPPELRRAFASTLEELSDSELLLHCIDASDLKRNQKIRAVETVLAEISLSALPILRVYNKSDQLQQDEIEFLNLDKDSICISAKKKTNLHTLFEKIEGVLFKTKELEKSVLEPHL